MNLLEQEYNSRCVGPSDINEHLPVLYEYASRCTDVVEMGVYNGNSTSAFLYANVKLRSYDVLATDGATRLFEIAKEMGKDVEYFTGPEIGNTLTISIDEVDMLFIDTEHTTAQLTKELELHGNKAKKYIAFHDTAGPFGAALNPAIDLFLQTNPHWFKVVERTNNNGLTILERKIAVK